MRFIVHHRLHPGMTGQEAAQMQRLTQRDPQIRGVRSFLNLSQCKAVFVYEAPDERRLAEWLEDNNLPYDAIMHVELEGEGGELAEPPAEAALRASGFGEAAGE